MTNTAKAYAAPQSTSFAAFALDIGSATFRPMLNRREIQNLFTIDAAKQERDPVWEAYFVESIVEFIVHGRRPTGVISAEDADWLIAQIGDDPSPSVPALLRGLVAEAENIPTVLIGYALACGAMRT